jgi:hypothetical protein
MTRFVQNGFVAQVRAVGSYIGPHRLLLALFILSCKPRSYCRFKRIEVSVGMRVLSLGAQAKGLGVEFT